MRSRRDCALGEFWLQVPAGNPAVWDEGWRNSGRQKIIAECSRWFELACFWSFGCEKLCHSLYATWRHMDDSVPKGSNRWVWRAQSCSKYVYPAPTGCWYTVMMLPPAFAESGCRICWCKALPSTHGQVTGQQGTPPYSAPNCVQQRRSDKCGRSGLSKSSRMCTDTTDASSAPQHRPSAQQLPNRQPDAQRRIWPARGEYVCISVLAF